MKKVIHYTEGYGGKLNYFTTCGKEIHSHSDKDDAVIDPAKVTCEDCKKTKQWKEDSFEAANINPDIKRRIFIESDILHTSALHCAQLEVSRILEEKNVKHTTRVFSEVFDYAWHDLNKLWEAVKKADEIYADSSLMPLTGGSYSGAPVIFNGMCERAIKENITGKDIYILNELKRIHWDMIKIPIMKKAFKKNNLFMYDENYNIVKVDVQGIKK